MRALKELVDLVSPQRLRRISFFQRYAGHSPTAQATQTQQLYELIHSGEVESDAGASLKLFDSSKDKRYPVLKHKLKEELLGAVLLVDGLEPKALTHSRLMRRCERDMAIADQLWWYGRFHASFDLNKRVFKEALKAEMSEVLIKSCEVFIRYYSFVDNNLKKRSHFRQLKRSWHHNSVAEFEVYEAYEELMDFYAKGMKTSEGLVASLEERLKKLSKYEEVNTMKYKFYLRFLQLGLEVDSGRFEGAFRLALKTVKELNANPYTPRVYRRNMLFQVVSSALILGQEREGVNAVTSLYTFSQEYSRPWYRALQFHLYLLIYCKAYTQAFHLANQHLTGKAYRHLAQDLKIRFRLIQAHLKWLEEMGEFGHLDVQLKAPRLLRRLPEISRDKEGFNIPFLTIQALLALSRRKWLDLEKRMGELDAYADKYLRRKAGLKRAYLFIKSISILKSGNRHPIYFKRHSQNYYEQLQACTRAIARQNSELEIIPYERIYELVLQKLEAENR